MRRLASLVLIISACDPGYERPAVGPVATNQPEPVVAPPPLDMDALMNAVVRVRGLSMIEKVPVEKMADADFEQAFRTASGTPDGAPVVVARDPQYFDGFYSFKTKSIAMRAKPKARDGDLRIVFAHEFVHALQHQHFHVSDLKPDSSDAHMALLSLVEGDAQLTAYGAVAMLDGIPAQRLMISASALHAGDDAEIALPELARLAYHERQSLVFPYDEGMRFVGTLYRAGGFDLVNKAYAAPPMQTSLVLHPEAYLAGRRMRAVAPVAFPRDANVTEPVGQRMGEVGLRGLLVSLGITPASAEANSGAWRGDWLEVGKVSGSPVVGGVVAMASEVDATALQQFLSTKGPASHRGDVVSFAFGLSQGAAERMMAQGFARVGAVQADAPPFGAVSIPAAPVPLEHQARFGGTFNGTMFYDAGLGLVVPVPGAYRVTINGPDALLLLANGMNAMALSLIDAGQTPWARALTWRSVMSEARKLGAVVSYSDQQVSSPFGVIPERVVVLADGRYFKVALAPICASRATLMIIRIATLQTWSFTEGILYSWLASIDGRGVEGSAFCREVQNEWM